MNKLSNKLLKDSPLILAPMAGVTHLPFRLLSRNQGASIVITELISVQSLYYNLKGEKHSQKLLHLIRTNEQEKPVGLQLFGFESKHFENLLKILDLFEMGFDFLDINVGCPVDKVCNPGAGSKLLTKDKLPVLEDIIKTINSQRPDIPLSIKIRAGYKEFIDLPSFAEMINQYELIMLTIHPRTAFQRYKEPANHELTQQLVELCDHPVIANGDISSLEDAKNLQYMTKSRGVMIGRAARKAPWVFNPDYQKQISVSDYLSLLRSYYSLCERFGYPNLVFIKEIFAGMIRGFYNSAKFRTEMGLIKDFSDIEIILSHIEKYLERKDIITLPGSQNSINWDVISQNTQILNI